MSPGFAAVTEGCGTALWARPNGGISSLSWLATVRPAPERAPTAADATRAMTRAISFVRGFRVFIVFSFL